MSETVGVRELRQNLSKYLDRVKAGEERFGATVPTERLEAVAARLSPRSAPPGTT
jgi:antitoxin (DNA-binding transcriptional repressor) of toxin-antitoxin stability system